MKKSQVMAAIALAFALGVVAPVASTYADEPVTYEVTRPGAVTSKATVDAAIAKIEAQPEYQAYDTLDELKSVADFDEADALEKLNAEIVKVDTKYEDATTLADALKAATELPEYDEWVALYSAMQPSTSVSVEQQIANIDKAAGALGFTGMETTGDNLNTVLETLQNEIGKDADYTKMSGVIALVDADNANIKTQGENVKALKSALATAGVDARDIEKAASDAKPVAALAALATTATNSVRGQAYATLRTAIDGAVISDTDSTDNTDLLSELAEKFEAAAGVALSDVTTPVTPEDPSDDPTTDEPGTDEPGSAVPADPSKPSVSGDGQGADGAADKAGASFGTPDTGVVAKSEGSASTSVSIMAAISTVVAGLGAAVVAVRNYKRNKNA